MEHTIWEYFKWLGWFILTIASITIFLFCYQVSSVNSYKQQVNYQIERKGGLTEEAIMELKNYSETHYNGSFAVKSNSANQQVAFGEIVDYEVVGTFKMIAFSNDIQATWKGSGVSMVR